MGSYHTISLLSVILYTSTPSAQKFVTLTCNHSVTGILNEDTTLPCTFKSIMGKTFNVIELSKYREGGEAKHVFNSKESFREAQDRIKLLHQDSQDISLVIQKTQLSDNGTYQYYLETSAGYRTQDIALKVKAPYNLPEVTLFPNLTRTMRRTNLTCETTGYPLAQIHWFVYDKKNLTLEAETNNVTTPQGLFKITSTLPIRIAESALEGYYTCAVWNEEEQKYEVQKHFPIPVLDASNQSRQSEGKKNKVLTAVFVIVAALLSGIAILIFLRFRRRFRPVRRESKFVMVPSD
uniref:CD276 antigen homolog isoform X2 n=1 Tax=Pristiophorus japonicus TaxID=55135 RepID=UPI00398E8AF1